MPESAISVFALVLSTAAVVLTVSGAASESWVGSTAYSTLEVECSLAQCCQTSGGVKACQNAVDFLSANNALAGFEARPSELVATIVFTIFAIFAAVIAWGYSLRAVFSDGPNARLKTAAKLSFMHVLCLIITVAAFANADFNDSLDAFVSDQTGTAQEESEYQWGFWLMVSALCVNVLAGILFFLAPIVVPEPDKAAGAGAPTVA